jgi:hypothetical protein
MSDDLKPYTVIGFIADGDVRVAGVIEGEHPVTELDFGDNGSWYMLIGAVNSEYAAANAIEEMAKAIAKDGDSDSDTRVVGVRFTGELKVHDSFEDLGYDLELFHTECADQGRSLFVTIDEEDHELMQFELDPDALPECPVCKKEIGK